MNNNTIKYFMWGFQKHMLLSLHTKAENLFKNIDFNLNPEITLIGLIDEESNDRHPVCIECYSNKEDVVEELVSQFSGLIELAKELEKVDPNSLMTHTHPVAQDNHLSQVKMDSYRKAIKNIIKKHDYRNEKLPFVSYPVKIEAHLVFVVLNLNKKAYDKHYSLRGKDESRFLIYKSFLSALSYEFIMAAQETLHNPDRGLVSVSVSDEELVRSAARRLTYTAAIAGSNGHGFGLYDACNEISSLRYEGASGFGSLIVCENGHSNIKMTLKLKKPIGLREYRKVRKILEMSGENASIITDSELIYGLGKIDGKYNPMEESLFEIRFVDHYEWMLFHDSIPMLKVKYGYPSLPKETIKREKFFSDSRRVFTKVTAGELDNLWDIVQEATKQLHGTLLVISENAESEAIRLGNQCFEIEPQVLPLEMINQVTSIDGALIVDTKSKCYATGVILDGLATDNGDSARGARYNSAIRYYDHICDVIPTMLIIISEDGMINIVPDLRPQINHDDIIKSIDDLEKMSKTIDLQISDYNKCMSYFNKIKFYLTQDECKKINELRFTIESNRPADEMRIVYEQFSPNKEMSASYYL